MLDIELLGQVRATSMGEPVDGLPNPRLLVYLVLQRGGPVEREQVAAALWPESSDTQALTNLRRELHLLRRALPGADELVSVRRRTLAWPADGPYRLDVAEFEAAIAAGSAGDDAALDRAIALYRGDLAPTIYDDWVDAPRERLRAAYGTALARSVSRLEERGELRAAFEQTRRLVAFDPLDEETYRIQIRLATLLGDRTGGMRAYHACVAVLRRELDVEPAPETRAAYERLLAGGGAATDGGGSAAAPGPDSAAVPAAAPRADGRLVGRGAELAALLAAAEERRGGSARLIAVRGESGIGKTRLIEEAVRRWAVRRGRAAATRSYAAEGALAYAPVAAWLRSEPIRGVLDTLDPVWRTELSRLVPELLEEHPGLPVPAPMTEGWQRQRLFEALARAVRAAPGPLLLVLDDAHWADRDTLEWVHYLLRAEPAVPAVVVAGIRAEEERANAALTALMMDLRSRDLVREIPLGPLDEASTWELAASASAGPLRTGARERVFHETGGHPLFTIEMVRAGLGAADERGAAGDPGATRELPAHGGAGHHRIRALPPRMQAMIAARLDRLPDESRQLVDVAATIGRDFDVELLGEAGGLDEAATARAIDELWQRQVIREQAAGSYDFTHDRVREVAEAAIAPGRHRLLHRRVAEALERLRGPDLDPVAAQLAAHYEAAGMPARAVDLHERAAAQALRMSSHADAARHLGAALDLLGRLPPSPDRDRRELALQLARSAPLNATLGYPAPQLQAALDRAQALAEQLGDRDRAVLALNGLYHVHFVRGAVRRSVGIAERALALADGEARLLAVSHLALAGPLSGLGEVDRSLAEFDAVLSTYDSARSDKGIFDLDPGVFALVWSAHPLWLRGRWTLAAERATAAVQHATALDNPLLEALTHAYSAIHCQLAGTTEEMVDHARVAMALCDRYGFPYYREWGAILQAWARRGRDRESATRIEAAIEALRSLGAHIRMPYYLALLADAHLATGQVERARAVLDAAAATAAANDDLWWLPEILRASGELEQGPGGEACLERALGLAASQGSFALAARAAASLARRRPDLRSAALGTVLGMADGTEDTAARAPLLELGDRPA